MGKETQVKMVFWKLGTNVNKLGELFVSNAAKKSSLMRTNK